MTSRFKKRAATLVVALATLGAGLTHAVGVPGQGTWETTLLPRDLYGDAAPDAFYDTALDITWLRDANVNGAMNWDTATNWADTLTVGAFDDWRLPTAALCYYTNCHGSEMGHLYYETLGNKAYPQPGWGLTNTGSFRNVKLHYYWSGIELFSDRAFFMFMHGGYQDDDRKSAHKYAMAVHPGDVGAPVPEPQTYAMLLLGLGGVLVAVRRCAA